LRQVKTVLPMVIASHFGINAGPMARSHGSTTTRCGVIAGARG
jgi:hypothetical protein